jgi:hypothetical protein
MKLFTFLAGIPVLVAMALFGITTIPSAVAMYQEVHSVEPQVKKMLSDARGDATQAKQEGAYLRGLDLQLRQQYGALQANVTLSQTSVGSLTLLEENLKAQVESLSQYAKATALIRATTKGAPQLPNLNSVSSDQGRVVYIQYADPSASGAMIQLQQALTQAGLVVPGIELVPTKWFEASHPNEVRYFHKEDRSIAVKMATLTNTSLKNSCKDAPDVVVPSTVTYARHPQATLQIEVWFRAGCGGGVGYLSSLPSSPTTLKEAVHAAVQNALYHDVKIYDSAQVMSAGPYAYVTPKLMRGFLLDVAHELARRNPPAMLNVNSLDILRCMSSTVGDLESYIYLAII